MIRFVHSEFLYALTIIPAMILASWLFTRMRARARMRFGQEGILSRIAEDASPSKRTWKLIVLLIAVAFLLIGLADPQIGTRMEDVKQEGVDIFIALDVSLSMKAEDIKPNRLEKAKFEIRNLIAKLAGDRVGLIVFAGDAFVQFPLTTDYSAANLFLDIIDVDAVPDPGTDIGAAIERAMDSFDFTETTTKVLVIITDGENNEGDVFDAAQEAAKKGVLIYTIGLGSPAGSPIPIYNAAGQASDFKRDRSGTIVLSKLDEAGLERIASIGGGKYFRGTNAQDELDEIYKTINALQKKEFGVKQFTDFEDRFQFFLAPAIAFLLLEILLTENKVRWLARWNPLKRAEEKQS